MLGLRYCMLKLGRQGLQLFDLLSPKNHQFSSLNQPDTHCKEILNAILIFDKTSLPTDKVPTFPHSNFTTSKH